MKLVIFVQMSEFDVMATDNISLYKSGVFIAIASVLLMRNFKFP